jgi:RNA polymerase sigma factor (sigma-70 family)
MPPELEREDAPAEASGQADADLLRAYLGGDEGAFETLVKRYFGLVYAAALRRLNDPSLAEDVTQSTFIILARKARAVSRGELLRVWLLKTARFVCKDALKSLRRRQVHEDALANHSEVQVAESAGESPGAGDFLEQALLKLPALDQACLVARFFEGRTFKETAGVLGISEDLAQKKVSRGLEKLRHYLTKRGLKTSEEALCGMLLTFQTTPASADLVHSALGVILPAANGKLSGGVAVTLAARNLRSLAWRKWMLLGAKAALPLLLCGGAGLSWTTFHGSTLGDPKIEALGKDWSVVVLRASAAMQKYQGRSPPPNTPEFQDLMQEVQFSVKEWDRISGQLQGMLKPGKDRKQLAEFITVEMRETLGLDRAQQGELYNYVSKGLSKGATLKGAMKTMAQSSSTEAGEVKAYLSANQCQVFDRVYGADGLCLFQYLKNQAATP